MNSPDPSAYRFDYDDEPPPPGLGRFAVIVCAIGLFMAGVCLGAALMGVVG